MLKPFIAILFAGIAVQSAVIKVRFNDLLYLRQSVDVLRQDDYERFSRHATRALDRVDIPVRHFDVIASVAHARQDYSLERRALGEWLERDPAEAWVRVRYADALRLSGDWAAAQREFDEVLRRAGGTTR